MSDWRINLALSSRDDSLVDVACAVSALPDPEDRRVTQQLVLSAIGTCATAGELIDRLDAMTPAERRALLDRARTAAGLESATAIDDRERFERAQREARLRSSRRDAEGKAFLGCAAEGCSAMPLGPTGLPEKIDERCWWCPEHRHLAGPDDHLPPDDVAAIGPHFELIPAPSVQAAMQAKDERRREDEERRRRERAAEAEAIRKAEERYYEEHRADPYVNPLSGAGWAGIT